MLTDEQIDGFRKSLPELPDEKKKRYIEELGLPEYDAGILTSERYIAEFFEKCIEIYNEPKKTSNFIMTDLLRLLKDKCVSAEDMSVTPKQLADTLKMIDDGKINITVGKTVFEEVFKTGEDPEAIVEKKGLVQINDTDELRSIIKTVIEENPKPVADYKGGNKKAMAFFVGQVMKATKGKANPKTVNEIIKEEIGKI